MKNLYGGVDFSTGELSVAIAEPDGKLVFESHLKLQGRDSANMLPWICDELGKRDVKFDDIGHWTCGTGPGSFTGLRIVAALISGLTFADNSSDAPLVRGVPSAIALAEAAVQGNSGINSVGVLYDGRRGELLAYNVGYSKDGALPMDSDKLPLITSEDQSPLDSYDIIVGLESEKDALLNVLTSENFEKIVLISSFPVAQLMRVDSKLFPWDRDTLTNPVYLRPPVHVTPSLVREIII